jgi:carbon monoxide dehydrogenase subunit G
VSLKIENSFSVPAGIEQSWRIINDVPRIVPCMPGAQLTDVGGDGSYRGNVKVKIGPVQLQFNGEARLHDIDPAARTMKMRSRASDAKGRGTVASEMTFVLAGDGERTRVDVVTDLTLTGSVAQYGRGAGLIKEVANQFTREFAANLEKLVREEAGAPITAAKPVSGFGFLLAVLRATVLRWLGKKEP